MKKKLRLLFICLTITLSVNCMKQAALKNNLGLLKTNLGGLSSKLKTLAEKLTGLKKTLSVEPKYEQASPFNQDALDIYALYGDDPAIINVGGQPRKLIRYADKDKDPRLEGKEKDAYTGYGYKTANLRELQACTKFLHTGSSTPKIRYAVPDFIGISSTNVKKYLGKKGLNIGAAWQTAVNTLTDEEQKASLASKTLNSNFTSKFNGIGVIESAVRDTFVNNAKIDKNLDTAFNTNKINAFISEAQKENLKLMVRSTGKEDTDKLANAGGNETIGNVNPTTVDILTAMGKGPKDPTTGEDKLGVVSSYFGLKSFTQRIKAGDYSLYEEPPTPALIQVMIGETPDEITSCGVMFTEEPGGGISHEKKKNTATGQILTTGITRIECSYGHNEGVVNSMVPVDVYYINNDQKINSIIRVKDKRIIPSPNGFKLITNDKNLNETAIANKDLIYQPALSLEEVKALKTLSNYLEFYYRKPMDVEFVLKKNPKNPTKRIIYIVQARPIVHNENPINPSYIVNTKFFADDAKVSGEVIGIAGGALRLVKNKDECVMADTLKEALEIYQKLDKTDNINCIFTKIMAPATSHEATQFRTEQKAVICFPEVKKIEKWLQDDKMVLVDLQQELAVIWDGDTNLDNAMLKKDRIIRGKIGYPIPMKLTLADLKDTKHKKKFSKLSVDELLENFKEFISEDAFNAVRNDAAQAAQTLKPGNASALTEINNCVGILKKSDEKTAKTKLLEICLIAVKLITKMIESKSDDADFIEQANLIFNHLLLHAKSVLPTLSITPDAKEYYKRLYEIRFLETILLQTSSENIFNNYSLKTLTTNIFLKESVIEKKLKNLKATVNAETFKLLVQYGTASSLILSDKVKQKWFELLTQLPQTAKGTQDTFNKMFKGLAGSNLLVMWFLLNFGPETKAYASISNKPQAEAIIASLSADYNKDEPFIKELNTQRNKMHQFSESMALWADKGKFGKQLAELTKTGDYFNQPTFFTSYQNAGNLGKVFAAQVMEEFITLFDSSIKEVEGSLKEDNKSDHTTIVGNVKTLINLFLSFLETWVTNFPGATQIDGPGWGVGNFPTLNKLQNAKALLAGITNFTKDQIKMTPTYDVSTAAIGGIKSDVLAPSTLEEVFTFVHQSLLNVISFLNKGIDIFNDACPEIILTLNNELQKTIKSLNSSFYPGVPTSITLTGFSVEGTNLKIKYNYPLRGHSMQLLVVYDTKSKIANIICEMAGTGGGGGGNEFERFDKIADYLDVTSKTLNLKLNYRFECNGKKIVWEWEISSKTPDETVKKVKNLLFEAVCLSFAVNFYTAAMTYEAKVYQETFMLFSTLGLEQNLVNQIIDFSYNGTRLHSVFVTALEKLALDASSLGNWKKTIEILGKLINENNPYRISTECFFFKKYHDPYGGGSHKFLGTLNMDNAEYHNLNVKNYLTRTNANILNIDSKRAYFKFREAKKIFNYLCQVSQKFDQICWGNFLDLIKSNHEFILNLEDLILDDMEGDGPTHPASANLENSGVSGRKIKLHESLKQLFQKAFANATAKDKAKETAEFLIVNGTGKPEWLTVKNLILQPYEFKFGKFSNAAQQAAIVQSIQTNSDNFLAQVNADDLFKSVYPAKKAVLASFINSLGQKVVSPNPQISQSAFNILLHLKTSSENISSIINPVISQIKANQAQLLQDQKITDFVSKLYELAPNRDIFLTEATEIAQSALKLPAANVKAEGKKLAKFILSKKPGAPFTPSDLIDLQEIKNYIDQYTFNDTPDQKGTQAIQQLISMGKTNKASVQNAELIEVIKNKITQGYYNSFTLNPNVLDLYALISEGIYTDPTLVDAGKADLMSLLNNNAMATTLVPGTPDQIIQRNKIKDFAVYLINQNKINAVTEVWPILQNCLSGDNKRRSLILILILFESAFKDASFIDQSLPFVLSKMNADPDATNYSRIANDCYEALKASINSKKYIKADASIYKSKLQTLKGTLDVFQNGKITELETLINKKYP